MSKRKLLWFVPMIVYVLFTLWYTNLSGPLSQKEIAGFVNQMERNDFAPGQIARMRQFLEEHSGRQFLMVNTLRVKLASND